MTLQVSLLLRERRGGLGMYGRASVVAETSLGTCASSQSTLLARNFSMTEISICCHAHPAAMIKHGDQYVPNIEQQALFKRARPLLLKYIQQQDENLVQKQRLRMLQRSSRRRNGDAETPEISENLDPSPVLTGPNRNRLTPNRNRQNSNHNQGGHRLAGKGHPACQNDATRNGG